MKWQPSKKQVRYPVLGQRFGRAEEAIIAMIILDEVEVCTDGGAQSAASRIVDFLNNPSDRRKKKR